MKEFRKRRSQRDELLFLALKALATLLLLVITLFLMRAAWGMYEKMADATAAQDHAEAELASILEQRQHVASTLGRSTSERGVEQQLRERYGVVKPGEGQIDVIRRAPATTTAQVQERNWWQRILHTLFVW